MTTDAEIKRDVEDELRGDPDIDATDIAELRALVYGRVSAPSDVERGVVPAIHELSR